jgi:hypothetical protein
LPGAALPQTGVSSPAGGFVVVLLAGAVTLIGLVISIGAVVLLFRSGPSIGRFLLLVTGLAALSPAVFLAIGFVYLSLKDSVPRTESWDFRTSRSVAGLDPKRRRSVGLTDHDTEYSFQGNIRSTVQLPGDRVLSGRAYLVIVEAMGDQITGIDWQGKRDRTAVVYQHAKQILRGLHLPDNTLDSWYTKVRGGQREWFRIESASEPRIQVDIRAIPGEDDNLPPEQRECYVNVYVAWSSVTVIPRD